MNAAVHKTGRTGTPLRGGGALAVDLAIMAAAGAFLAAIGPFDTDTAPPGPRTAYWMSVMLIGGLLVHAVDRVLRHHLRGGSGWLTAGLTALIATPVQTGVVMASGMVIFGYRPQTEVYLDLMPAVAVITLAAIAMMRLARRAAGRPSLPAEMAPGVGSDLETGPEPDLAPDPAPAQTTPPPAGLARRLPRKLRGAALIALEAEDHYVRVHTQAGSALVLIRFADAVALAGGVGDGYRLHRSWWASAASLEAVKFRRGAGEARLAGGLAAPVSRTYAPALRDAGWF